MIGEEQERKGEEKKEDEEGVKKKEDEEEKEKKGEEEKEDKEERNRREEDRKIANEIPKETKEEFTGNKKWAEGYKEAINGGVTQKPTTTTTITATTTTTTTARIDTTDRGMQVSKEDEDKAVKAEHEPQQHQGTESGEGGTEKQNNSSPSSSIVNPGTTRPSDVTSLKRVNEEVSI